MGNGKEWLSQWILYETFIEHLRLTLRVEWTIQIWNCNIFSEDFLLHTLISFYWKLCSPHLYPKEMVIISSVCVCLSGLNSKCFTYINILMKMLTLLVWLIRVCVVKKGLRLYRIPIFRNFVTSCKATKRLRKYIFIAHFSFMFFSFWTLPFLYDDCLLGKKLMCLPFRHFMFQET